jgi:MarR-like DNA-binding transcriptional regulator SgrR of sgrS sRNA
MLLASAAGQPTTAIARTLRCNDQTVRNALHAFQARGLAALQPQSSRPHTTQATCDAQGRERLQALLPQSPRTFGNPTSLWTLTVAAAVRWPQGLTSRQVSGETIRATLAQMGGRWQRAKHWMTSPDPA